MILTFFNIKTELPRNHDNSCINMVTSLKHGFENHLFISNTFSNLSKVTNNKNQINAFDKQVSTL